MKTQYNEKGFVVAEILKPDELKICQDAMRDLLDRVGTEMKTNDLYSEQRALGVNNERSKETITDSNDAFEAGKVIQGCAKPEILESAVLSELIVHPTIHSVMEEIMGGKLILDNAVLLFGKKDVRYRQGWHRDTVGIPESASDCLEAISSPQWFHNCIQFNVAISNVDRCFWCVPGSHNRPYTEEEKNAFPAAGPLNTPSHLDAEMPGGVEMILEPGWALFFNNNIIHRGYADPLKADRGSFHANYHCKNDPPTWHFHTGTVRDRFRELPKDKKDNLSDKLKNLMRDKDQRHKQYADINDSYYAGLKS